MLVKILAASVLVSSLATSLVVTPVSANTVKPSPVYTCTEPHPRRECLVDDSEHRGTGREEEKGS